jgi:two-component system NarL family response regulator
MIRIMLVDDHTIIREALCTVLDQDDNFEIVAEAGDGETALLLADKFTPDVVVMDVALSGESGIETTRKLLGAHPETKVLALSTYLDRRIVEQMLQVGARGYIAKSAAGSELKKGILSIVEGRSYLCAEAGALLADGLRAKEDSTDRAAGQVLSRREVQVTTLLAEGKTTPEIATLLHISGSTVDVHRRNLMRKLDLHNVVQITKYAIRTGLIQP